MRPAVERHLASSWQSQFGVRHLATILRNRIVEQLAVADAQGELKGVEEIRLELLPEDRAASAPGAGGYALRQRDGKSLTVFIR